MEIAKVLQGFSMALLIECYRAEQATNPDNENQQLVDDWDNMMERVDRHSKLKQLARREAEMYIQRQSIEQELRRIAQQKEQSLAEAFLLKIMGTPKT